MYFEAVLKNNGYTVIVAKNGEDALDVMDKEHIDLVVLDIMMPKMDGYEFTKTLRECDNNLPILMVSAKQLPIDKNKGFAVGTDDYMTKPVNQDEFLYRIKALLRRAKISKKQKILKNIRTALCLRGTIAEILRLVNLKKLQKHLKQFSI